MKDVGANVGVMIASGGFDAGAKAIAQQEEITLTNYRKAEKTDWFEFLRKMSTPGIIVKGVAIVRCDIELEEKGVSVSGSLDEFRLYTADGNSLGIFDCFEPIRSSPQLNAQPIGRSSVRMGCSRTIRKAPTNGSACRGARD